MKKIKLILLTILILGLSIITCFAAYLIIDSKISTNISNVETGKYKVTFTDNDTVVKTMYVDSGYNLSLKDAPYYTTNGQYYSYTCTMGGGTFNLANHLKVTDNVSITCSKSGSYTGSSSYYENLDIGLNQNISTIDNYVKLNQYAYNGTMNAYIKTIKENGIAPSYTYEDKIVNEYNDLTNYLNSKIEKEGTSWNKFDKGKVKVIGDKTIALETIQNDTSQYKPNVGNTTTNNSTNYCVTKFTLNNDVIFNGTFNLGGTTGYYGNNTEWSQINFQGFIIGSYSEIDLNGYDLIIANGATLRSYGSITDSKGGGNLILESGATLYSPFVVEDHYREDSMATAYFYNSAVFTMYKMPYLNCNTIINNGAKVYGNLRVDLGADNSNATEEDLPIIGPDSNFMIQTASNGSNSRIVRTVSYDDSFTSAFVKSNLVNIKIRYDIYDTNITYNQISFSIDYSVLNVGFNFGKFQFYISPYYSFYLYNSSIILSQCLVFMPGSYLFIDDYSSITLSYGDIETASRVKSPFSAFTIEEESKFQNVGGLIFLDKTYSFSEAKAWIDTRKQNGGSDGYGEDIFNYNSTNNSVASDFWNKINQTGSMCDMYGEIDFTYNNNIEQCHEYELGGKINIYSFNSFEKTMSNLNENIKINLYGKTYKTGPNRLNSSTLFEFDGGMQRMNIISYHILPLISSGYVVMDISNPCKISTISQSYDSKTGLIKSNGGYYGYIFNDESISNLYKCKTNSLTYNSNDSLSGGFKQVAYNSITNLINYNNTTYMFYHGAFVPGDGTNFSLNKFFDSNNSHYNSTFKLK